MRILWCHEVSYRDKPVYEYQDFPERLAARGHAVEVIDFDEGRATQPATAQVSRTGEGTVALSTIAHHGIPALKYLEARLRYRRMLEERLRAGAVDAAFVYSIFINGVDTVQLCRRHGVPVVARVLDAYHRLRPGRVTRALLRHGEQYVYRHADRILTTNEDMTGYVVELAGLEDDARVTVVDHGVDGAHFAPRARDQALAARLGIRDDDRVMVFLGTTYAFSGLVNLVRRLPALVAREPRLKLLIVGAGEMDDALGAEVDATGMAGHVVRTGMIDYRELPPYLSLAEIALNPFEINAITRDIVPIKILQYQASGLATVSTPLPDLHRKHPPQESGVCYSETDDADAFVHALAALLERPAAIAALAERGRRFVEDRYTVDRAIDTVEAALCTLVAAKREKADA